MSYDFNYYSGKDIQQPTRPKKPVLPVKPTPDELRAYADQLEIYDALKMEYNEKVSDYRSKKNDRLEKFKQELMVDYDLLKPQVDVIWGYAYEAGHSAGLQEVCNYFDEYYGMILAFNRLKKKEK